MDQEAFYMHIPPSLLCVALLLQAARSFELSGEMEFPIPRTQERAWTCEGPKVGGKDCGHLRLS